MSSSMPDKTFAIGLDLGGPAESHALALVEAIRPPGWDPSFSGQSELGELRVRGLHRFPAGTTYTAIGNKVLEVLQVRELADDRTQTDFIVDQTAAGDPIVREIERIACKPACRMVIGGQHVDTYLDGIHHIPRKNLIAGVVMALEGYHLKIAEALPQTQNLIEEFKQYRNRPTSVASLSTPDFAMSCSSDIFLRLFALKPRTLMRRRTGARRHVSRQTSRRPRR